MSEDEQSPAPVVDAAEPEAATDSNTAPAVIDPNAPDPTPPSGGDTAIADAEPAQLTIIDIDQDSAIAAYEADRLAAINAGDTSWPTWGFLDLEKKLTYLMKPEAG